MATGVEAAGLCLAAFSIALECIVYYQKVKEIWQYRQILEEFRGDVETESVIFRTTLTLLDFAQQSRFGGSQMAVRLFSECAESIGRICVKMTAILKEIALKLQSYEQTKVRAYTLPKPELFVDFVIGRGV